MVHADDSRVITLKNLRVGGHNGVGYLKALAVDEKGTFYLIVLVNIIPQFGIIIIVGHTGKTVHKLVNDALVAFNFHIHDRGIFLCGDVQLLSRLFHFQPRFIGEKIIELLRLLEIKSLKIVHPKYHTGDYLVNSLNALRNGHSTNLLCSVDNGAENLLIVLIVLDLRNDSPVYLDDVGVYEHNAV